MTLEYYQSEARKTAQYPKIGHNIIYPTLGLTGEAGEVSDKVKKIFRDNGGVITEAIRIELTKEIGDVLWYVSAFCDEIGISMEHAAAVNIEKLNSRQQRGTIGGDGDNR